jgi:hypothetical protein
MALAHGVRAFHVGCDRSVRAYVEGYASTVGAFARGVPGSGAEGGGAMDRVGSSSGSGRVSCGLFDGVTWRWAHRARPGGCKFPLYIGSSAREEAQGEKVT